jgi:superfamily I DNA/RNA helicase
MAYEADGYLDPDSYKEIPNKRKTVCTDTYELIYTDVWEKWYRDICQNGSRWDDQDLTRRVLTLNDAEISGYPAVFCDEAQDFTSIELELILRLSLFSQRQIPPRSLRLVPFAFAGDPFQTLNPTGFDWNAVQSTFHESIVQALDRAAQASLEFNYRELSFSYRSTRNIVGFCNLLQLLRGVLFDIGNLRPQRAWFDDDDSSLPVYFNLSDAACQRKIEEQPEMVIIVPCQEGDESDYVAGDPLLSQIVSREGEIRNILSPMSAKGLEFSRVVLYKFGEDFCQNYPQSVDSI